MNEEHLNMQVRKFLKKVGINAQREIETHIRTGMENGSIKPGDSLQAKMHLTVEDVSVDLEISETIDIE